MKNKNLNLIRIDLINNLLEIVNSQEEFNYLQREKLEINSFIELKGGKK